MSNAEVPEKNPSEGVSTVEVADEVLEEVMEKARVYLEEFASGDYYIDIEEDENKGFVYLVVNRNTGVDEAVCKLLPQAIDYVSQLNTSMSKVKSGRGAAGSNIQVVPANTKLN